MHHDQVRWRFRPERETTDAVLDWVMTSVGLICIGYGIAVAIMRFSA